MTRDRKLRKIREQQFKRLNEPIPPEKQVRTLLDRVPPELLEAQQRLIEEATRRGGSDIRTPRQSNSSAADRGCAAQIHICES